MQKRTDSDHQKAPATMEAGSTTKFRRSDPTAADRCTATVAEANSDTCEESPTTDSLVSLYCAKTKSRIQIRHSQHIREGLLCSRRSKGGSILEKVLL
mmetsp:Transcript_25119/g.36780  ORF Transcript_25119/g.36780 Transcript_25119/m.36780 type:complete len:98 (-) Transcript_25119:3295-3588(-)